MKEVVLVIGAGQISLAIARGIGYGNIIVSGDKKLSNVKKMQSILKEVLYIVIKVYR